MKKINYVTGNPVKISYAKSIFEKFGLEVVQRKLDFQEIQSHDKLGVATDKAKQAFEIIKEPLFVTDTFWEIPSLNGFPGAYMKYINEWFRAEDFLALMKDKKDRRIFCNDSIVYIDEKGIKTFTQIDIGEFAETIYEDGEKKNSIDNLVKFSGRYLKEHHKENWANFSEENKNWQKLADFLNNTL